MDIEKISFTDYYKQFAELQSDLRKLVCEKLNISEKTFYNKINADSFNDLERTAIAKVVNEFNCQLSQLIN